jgi:hypothetical protein
MSDTPQMPSMMQTASEEWDKHAFRYLAALASITLAVGTVVYHFMEKWTWVDAFYFSSVALTTVGFGDLTPSSDASKLFTVFYIFSGISLIGATLHEFMTRRAVKARSRHTGN